MCRHFREVPPHYVTGWQEAGDISQNGCELIQSLRTACELDKLGDAETACEHRKRDLCQKEKQASKWLVSISSGSLMQKEANTAEGDAPECVVGQVPSGLSSYLACNNYPRLSFLVRAYYRIML